MTQYVVVRHTKDFNQFSLHVYSKKSSNKDVMEAYMESLKPKYPKDTEWKVTTVEQAKKISKAYTEWFKKEEERRWARAIAKTRKKRIIDHSWTEQELMRNNF
jgi:hypothetical protein